MNAVIGDFVSFQNLGEYGGFEKFCSMGVFHNGAIEAGVVMHNWFPDTRCIELSAAALSPRWLTRNVIKELAHIVFNMLKARIAILRVSEHNADMRTIARRAGFRETVIPQIRGDNEAECVYTLTASDWASNRLNR